MHRKKWNNKVDKIREFVTKKDEREVFISGQKKIVVFDSGATESIIKSKALNNLGKFEIKKEDKIFKLINGQEIKISESVDIPFQYERREFCENFNIVKNFKGNRILLCNNVTKEIEMRKKEIPIKCYINTKDYPPISWSRPIKSLQDKKKFQMIVKDSESRGIAEESRSSGLNPVVLVRKKNGNIWFCVDFR